MFDKLIVKVEKKEGTLYTYEGVYGYERTAMDFLYGFPRELFEDEKDKFGVLAHYACGDVVTWFYEVITYLLAGKLFSSLASYSLPSNLLHSHITIQILLPTLKTTKRWVELKK